MRISGIALGSHGDVKPFINLGCEFRKRGHDFTLATFREFEGAVRERDLEYAPLDGSSAQLLKTLFSTAGKPREFAKNYRSFYGGQPRLLGQTVDACAESEAIVYNQLGELSYHAAEATGAMPFRTVVYPADRSRRYTLINPRRFSDSPIAHLAHFWGTAFMSTVMLPVAQAWRQSLGLSPWHRWSSHRRLHGAAVPTLYQFSPVLVPRDPRWKDHVHVTGEWLADRVEPFDPPAELVEFLRAGPPPVLVNFGSMVCDAIPELRRRIQDSLGRLGHRGVFVGFDGRTHAPGDGAFDAQFLPFDWIMPRCRAAVHHGGSGTTHAALRAGIPSLVVAFGGDQQFWGHRVHTVGAGPQYVDLERETATPELVHRRMSELLGGDFVPGMGQLRPRFASRRGAANAVDAVLAEAARRHARL